MPELLFLLNTVTALSSGINAWYFATLVVTARRRRLGATVLSLVCLGTLLAHSAGRFPTAEPLAIASEGVRALGSLAITLSIGRHGMTEWLNHTRGEE